MAYVGMIYCDEFYINSAEIKNFGFLEAELG